LVFRTKVKDTCFDNSALRRIFRRKREEVAGGWRRLHNEELRNLYASRSIIRLIKSRIGWARHVARMEEMRNAHRSLIGKPEGKKEITWKA
jgi:hypothetical protein